MKIKKLTKKEYESIEQMISYFSSLDLDIINDGTTTERDFLKGLIKLKVVYLALAEGKDQNHTNVRGLKHGTNTRD